MTPEAAGALVHTLFEAAAYAAGSRLFFALRRRHGHATDHPDGAWVLVGAVLVLGGRTLSGSPVAVNMTMKMTTDLANLRSKAAR